MGSKKRLITITTVVMVIFVGAWAWQTHQRAVEAERQAGLASARAITFTFQRINALNVGRGRGAVVAEAETTSARMFTVKQQTKAPYTVDYSVDLSRLPRSAYRWNGEAREMYIDLPEVNVGTPNIDMSRAESRQTGWYVSRRSGLELQRVASKRLALAAEEEAKKLENINKAQDNARAAVERLVQAPLAAAGVGDVRVIVRLRGEATPPGVSREQWDVSRSLEEVFGNR